LAIPWYQLTRFPGGLGDARAIIATAPDTKAVTELIGGLGPNGTLLIIGVSSGKLEFAPTQLIRGGKTIEGWAGVTPGDSEGGLWKCFRR